MNRLIKKIAKKICGCEKRRISKILQSRTYGRINEFISEIEKEKEISKKYMDSRMERKEEFNAVLRGRSATKYRNMINFLEKLEKNGYSKHIKKHTDYHYTVLGFDFWPTTGSFYEKETGKRGKGVNQLIKNLYTKTNI